MIWAKVFLLLASVTAVLTESARMTPKLADGKIIGGVDAKPHEFPSIVSLRLRLDKYYHICAGTLLDAWTVLTAAHCLGREADRYSVVAGAHHFGSPSGEEVTSQAEYLIPHEEFDQGGFANNDVGVIWLQTPIDAVPGVIEYAKLADRDVQITEGEKLAAVGWGVTIHEGPISPILQKVNLTYATNKQCNDALGDGYDGVKPGMMCTLEPAGGLATCNGDSGGPLFKSDGTQVGITSWGIEGCSHPNKPSVFTRISSYTDWILDHVRK